MQVPCPYCGPRDENEFTYGGQPQTAPAPQASDAAWAAYLFTRPQVSGPVDEVWCHTHGCGAWFSLRRDPSQRRFEPPAHQDEGGPNDG